MNSERKQITRTRISYSCITCRRRKVKCNKVHPVCGGCLKIGETCIWGEEQPGSSETNGHEQAGLVRKRKANGTGDDASGDSAVELPMLKVIEQKLANLTALMGEVSALTPPPDRAIAEDAQFLNAHGALPRMASVYSIQGPSGGAKNIVSSDSDGSLPAFENILKKLDQLNISLRTQTKQPSTAVSKNALCARCGAQHTLHSSSTSTPAIESASISASVPSIPSNPKYQRFGELVERASDVDLLAPTKEEASVLFRSWLWSTYAIFPLLSPHLIWAKYQAFRDWYENDLDRGEPCPDQSFMPLIYSVWHSGLNNLNEKGVKKWFPWSTKDVLLFGMNTRSRANFEKAEYPSKPTEYSLTAALMFHFVFLQDRDNIQNAMELTAALRAAQSMNLHNERAMPSAVMEAEERRRMWWELINSDISLSAASGMPPVFDEAYADTKLPSEIKTSELRSAHFAEYTQRMRDGDIPDRADDPVTGSGMSMISVHHLVARARYTIAAATRKMLKVNMRAKPMTREDMKEGRMLLMATGKEVRAIIDRITTRGVPELDFVPQVAPFASADHLDEMSQPLSEKEISYFLGKRDVSASDIPLARQHRMATAAFHKWARITLSLMLDRLNCLSYAPFLKNAKSRLWAVARSCALKDCHSFMRKLISLATDPELERFRWLWPSFYQPIHAAIHILIDVYERPFSSEAPRSRAFIDKMFSIAIPDTGVVGATHGYSTAVPLKEGGVEAWNMLRTLRHKAWQKAGLDPDLLWTEEDQIEVGICVPPSESDRFMRTLREDVIDTHNTVRDPDGQAHKDRMAALAAGRQQLAEMWKNKNHIVHTSQTPIPGEKLVGAVARGITDLEKDLDKYDLGLLRARHDQQRMPFPLRGDSTVSKSQQREPPREPFKNAANMLHVGELISKIRSMQAIDRENANATTNGQILHSSVDSVSQHEQPEFSDVVDENHPQCSFKTMRHVEDAAYQDLIERNNLLHPEQSTQWPNYSHGDATQHERDQANSAEQQAETPRYRFAFMPGLYDQAYPKFTPTAVNKDTPVSQAMQAETPANNNFETASANDNFNQNIANDLAMTNPIDTDFDWNKWDEVFNGFVGFTDMLGQPDTSGFDLNTFMQEGDDAPITEEFMAALGKEMHHLETANLQGGMH